MNAALWLTVTLNLLMAIGVGVHVYYARRAERHADRTNDQLNAIRKELRFERLETALRVGPRMPSSDAPQDAVGGLVADQQIQPNWFCALCGAQGLAIPIPTTCPNCEQEGDVHVYEA